MESSEQSEIQKFFSGKTLFITGVTGFLGSVLLEKILRSCPDVDKIYALVRAKRGEEAQDRLKKLFNCEVSKKKTKKFI